MAITTRSGKVLSSTSMGKVVEKEVSVDKLEGSNLGESEKMDGFVDISEKENNKKEELTVNVPLMEELEQMPYYDKFMKELLTKKRKVSCEPVDNIHHRGAVSSESLVQKKPDPRAFTIPCTVGSMNFTKALCDIVSSINLMPLDIYKNLGLGEPTSTTIHLVMADRSVK
ncbi:uncharacterized protein LOC107844174 [Capsicum annuum]|uniref:uncharacterized protein LOC107844174 n=1 Tax=Capsicum annuum TaxID=4072 RepID=UPI001FB16774|nr:uncharacterized protein LOC107844174 [Capsicum annuum]